MQNNNSVGVKLHDLFLLPVLYKMYYPGKTGWSLFIGVVLSTDLQQHFQQHIQLFSLVIMPLHVLPLMLHFYSFRSKVTSA